MSLPRELEHVVVLMLENQSFDSASAANSAFRVDRLGVRVPALLISPWVRKGHVDRRTYDHTSLLATVKALFDLPEFLTRRDTQAHTFDDTNFLDAPRGPDSNMPSNLGALLPGKTATGFHASTKISDLQRSFLALRTGLGGDAPQFSAGVLPDRGESQAP